MIYQQQQVFVEHIRSICHFKQMALWSFQFGQILFKPHPLFRILAKSGNKNLRGFWDHGEFQESQTTDGCEDEAGNDDTFGVLGRVAAPPEKIETSLANLVTHQGYNMGYGAWWVTKFCQICFADFIRDKAGEFKMTHQVTANRRSTGHYFHA